MAKLGISGLKEVAVSFKDKILIKDSQKGRESGKGRSTSSIIKGLDSRGRVLNSQARA